MQLSKENIEKQIGMFVVPGIATAVFARDFFLIVSELDVLVIW